MIDTKDISIVFQGAITPWTRKAVDNARKHLRGAKIILSTWEGSDVAKIAADEILFNEDPGSFPCYNNDKYGIIHANINRQLISTKNGLSRVKTEYAFKLRSDLIMKSGRIKRYFGKFGMRDHNMSFFEERVLVNTLCGTLYSDVDEGYPTPFHTSDFFYFGLTSDIKKFFDAIPLIDDEEKFAKWPLKKPDKNPRKHLSLRYTPEQYFTLSALSMYVNVPFEDVSDWSSENCSLSEKIIMNNFVPLDYVQHKIYTPKHERLIMKNNGRKFVFSGYMNFKWFTKNYKKMYYGRIGKLRRLWENIKFLLLQR
jgi:hypothetical protein